ncbi:helix-turn-helix domain-containing protein [Heyndrickxia sp. MSNUG]|uniref:helix-turn-helix domain-containing protein n=1 Tax=Heyndrickxia sp. MSNUG TaxID=3136677 RepID=UPI003C3092D7
MNAIGQNIKNCRMRKGMSLEELALKSRVGTQTIERYESGEQTPNLQTILKISTVLDVPASELMGQQIYVTAPTEADPTTSSL